ncbi:MAG: hypothetical protein ACR2F1_02180 [Nitrososphaeraceae archaeon]
MSENSIIEIVTIPEKKGKRYNVNAEIYGLIVEKTRITVHVPNAELR